MNIDEIRDALAGISLVCNETHARLQARAGAEFTSARVQLLALASHCVSAGRLLEDLATSPEHVLEEIGKDEEPEVNGDGGEEA